jgi:hypothetical protein
MSAHSVHLLMGAHHKDFTHFIDRYYFIATAIDFIPASNNLPPLL